MVEIEDFNSDKTETGSFGELTEWILPSIGMFFSSSTGSMRFMQSEIW